jgi:hypothetical protein
MGYASQRDYYVPSGVLSEEEKAAIRANERVNGAALCRSII